MRTSLAYPLALWSPVKSSSQSDIFKKNAEPVEDMSYADEGEIIAS